jgi:RES domain-containing protein
MEKVYAWRLAKAKNRESALDGVGSALGGGRWNSVGTPVVYCASTLALAVLEVRVHIPLANFQPRARYVGLEIFIDSACIERAATKLPSGWRITPAASIESTAARKFGDQWVTEKRSVALRLPSAVIPSEFIYLLNPAHLDFSRAVQLGKGVDVFLDPRLWR